MSIDQSQTIGHLAAALAAAAPALRDARKDRGNSHLKSKYATLESFLEAVRDPLAAQGVAITQGVSAGQSIPVRWGTFRCNIVNKFFFQLRGF
jgi:hypothetical protein